jgi:hypothetical protein
LALLRFGEMYANAALTLIPSTTLRGNRPSPAARARSCRARRGSPVQRRQRRILR